MSTSYRSETQTKMETFFGYYDAQTWLDAEVREFEENLKDEWVIKSAQLIKLNEAWRVGIVFEKAQGDLFDAMGISEEQIGRML